ncbi:HEPN/Toprim-associated domain-containing protein [Aeromonas caviae]
MGSFAEIRINGIELESWKNTYYEWYFTRSDRVREVYDDIEGNEHEQKSFIGYRISVETLKRRLQLDGYDLESAKRDFENTINIWISDMVESLDHYKSERDRSITHYARAEEINSFFIKNISSQLEIARSATFEEWCSKIIEAKLKKYEYYDTNLRMEPVEIENEPLLSLMLSELFGVYDERLGVGGSIFPCMQIESLAVVLLSKCDNDDICELDITDLVGGGWVDDFEDIEQVQAGKTHFYKIFENSLIELKDIKLDESTPVLQRMIFSSVITAMEAYLSDTLKKNVLNRDAIKKRFVKNSEHLKNSKRISLNDIFDELIKLDEKITDEIDSISYHNVDVVTGLYKNVLLCSFPNDKIARLSKSVEIRHDIVHRNGHKKDGSIIHIAKEDVENLITLVSDVVSHIDKQILDGLLDTGEQY